MKPSPVFKNLQDSTFQWLKAIGINVNKMSALVRVFTNQILRFFASMPVGHLNWKLWKRLYGGQMNNVFSKK